MQDTIIGQIPFLLTAASSPFVHVQCPSDESPKLVAHNIQTVLSSHQERRFRVASIDGVQASIQMRINFDAILSTFGALESYVPVWEDGCPSYTSSSTGDPYNASFPTFINGLRAISKSLPEDTHLVVMILNPEHLVQSSLTKEAFQPLCNLAELAEVSVSLTTLIVSTTPWALLSPSLGSSPEPLVLSLPTPNKADTQQYLLSLLPPFDSQEPSLVSILAAPFIQNLISLSSPVTSSRSLLARVLARSWPKFISFAKSLLTEPGEIKGQENPTCLPDSSETRLIVQNFTSDLHRDLLLYLPSTTTAILEVVDTDYHVPSRPSSALLDLPVLTQFVVVAAYLCSHSPPRMDMRLFFRSHQDDRGKKKKGGGTKKTPMKKTGGKAKIPQILLGPTAFPLARLLAVLGFLLAEHDASCFYHPKMTKPAKKTREDEDEDEDDGGDNDKEHPDVECQRVSVLSSITHLSNLSLLTALPVPASAGRGQGRQYRCNLTYEEVGSLATALGIGDIRAQGLVSE